MTPQIGRTIRHGGEPSEDLELWIGDFSGGRAIRNWESISVSRSIASAAGTFRVMAARHEMSGVRVGQELDVVLLGPGGTEQNILVGNIDSREEDLDGSVSISGRDRTGDLVDCSAKPETWVDATLSRIAQDLAAPFRVRVDLSPSVVDPVISGAWSVTVGETAWDAIERLLRAHGLLGYSGFEGNLIVGRAGDAGDAVGEVVEGVNCSKARLSRNDANRHRTYLVRGQRAGSDQQFGALVAHSIGQATDEGISRPRRAEIVAEGSVDSVGAELRAQWEATVRAAQANRLEATCPGLRQPVGATAPRGSPPWEVNLRVPVQIPTLRVPDSRLLLETVKFQRSRGSGTTTDLRFVPLEAYTPKPAVEIDLGDSLDE